MNRSVLFLLAAGCATSSWAQTATPPSATPSTAKADPEAIAAQTPAKVVAIINGKPVTAKQAVDLLGLIPAEQRKTVSSLQAVVQQLYMVTDLAKQATAEKLDQSSPYKERIEVEKDGILAQAFAAEQAKKSAVPVDAQQYYNAHTSEFDLAKVSGIVVAFNPPGTPASANGINRTEQAARAKADEVSKKLKAGSDFSTTARTDSDDTQSATRGGEIGTLSAGMPNVPADLKDVIFNKLQPGQISEPVRGNNAFYILRVESRSKQTFEQAKPSIEQQLKADHDRLVSQQLTDKYKIQVQDPAFFGTSAATVSSAAKVPSLQHPAAPK